MTDADDTVITKTASVGTGGTDFVGTSGSLAGSGTGSASSTPLTGLGGPWYIERQTLDIYYARVPQQMNASTTVTLAAATTSNGPMEATDIVYYAVANVNATIVYQTFSTSSVQQPQVFTVNAASGDINGTTYGTITSSTLGPMGSIITTTPYVRRTLYTGASNQTNFSKTAIVSNWGALRSPVQNPGNFAGLAFSAEAVDAQPFMYDLKFHKDGGSKPGTSKESHTYNFPGGIEASFRPFNDYQIVGAYTTTKESLAQINAFIDTVGTRMTNEQHLDWPIAEIVDSGFFAGRLPKLDQGIAEYDINRHS
jgi:hypothetical protein